MATESELNDLRERIARLEPRELLHLLESALGDHRRYQAEKRVEVQAQNLAAIEALRDAERRQDAEGRKEIAALEVWHIQRQRASGFVEGAKRDAG